jgi:hypothetical protein
MSSDQFGIILMKTGPDFLSARTVARPFSPIVMVTLLPVNQARFTPSGTPFRVQIHWNSIPGVVVAIAPRPWADFHGPSRNKTLTIQGAATREKLPRTAPA